MCQIIRLALHPHVWDSPLPHPTTFLMLLIQLEIQTYKAGLSNELTTLRQNLSVVLGFCPDLCFWACAQWCFVACWGILENRLQRDLA